MRNNLAHPKSNSHIFLDPPSMGRKPKERPKPPVFSRGQRVQFKHRRTEHGVIVAIGYVVGRYHVAWDRGVTLEADAVNLEPEGFEPKPVAESQPKRAGGMSTPRASNSGPPRYCLVCNVPLIQKRYPDSGRESDASFAERRYCSAECRNSARAAEVVDKECAGCGQKMERKRYKGGRLEIASAFNERKCCSRQCLLDVIAGKPLSERAALASDAAHAAVRSAEAECR